MMSRICLIYAACAMNSLVIATPRLDVFLNEVRSLSQLPMEKLIHIKSAFSAEQEMQENGSPLGLGSYNQSSPPLPIALPLRRRNSNNKPVKRHDDYWQDDKGKGSKISKIFQLAITALSFFAFGGYLLTLIITALKRNNTSTTTGNVIFLQGLQNVRRPKRGIFNDPMENDFNTERLYKGMIMLSEGYALYN